MTNVILYDSILNYMYEWREMQKINKFKKSTAKVHRNNTVHIINIMLIKINH